MNWPLLIGFISFMIFWYGLARLFSYWGFMKEEKELLARFVKQ